MRKEEERSCLGATQTALCKVDQACASCYTEAPLSWGPEGFGVRISQSFLPWLSIRVLAGQKYHCPEKEGRDLRVLLRLRLAGNPKAGPAECTMSLRKGPIPVYLSHACSCLKMYFRCPECRMPGFLPEGPTRHSPPDTIELCSKHPEDSQGFQFLKKKFLLST